MDKENEILLTPYAIVLLVIVLVLGTCFYMFSNDYHYGIVSTRMSHIVVSLMLCFVAVLFVFVKRIKSKVTALQQYNEKITHQKDELLLNSTVSEEGENLKSKFLSNLNHVFGTPLNSVIAYTDIMLADKHEPILQDNLNHVKENAIKIRTLLESIIYLSRIESHDIHFEFARCDIDEIIIEAVRDLSPIIEKKKISVKVNSGSGVCMALCDRLKLIDAIKELLKNAMLFSKNLTLITISKQKLEEHVKISIIDAGIGIPSYELDQVFLAFNTSSRTDQGQGSIGMGLTVAKSIIEAHNGTINLKNNNHNDGITAVIILPLAEETEEDFYVD